jgi:hypothetical protein
LGGIVSGAEAEHLAKLVHACADISRGDPDLPIIVLWSARGSESSELLDGLRKLEDWHGPRAFLDGEHLPTEVRPHVAISQLAFQHGHAVAQFGKVRFPRLVLGLWAVRNPREPNPTVDRYQWKQFLKRKLLGHGRATADALRTLFVGLGGLAGASDEGKEFLGLGFDGAFNLARTVKVLRSQGLRWYRDALETHYPDPADALLELSVQEFNGNHGVVDEVLCRAFLADLRAEFGARFTPYPRHMSALVLLDNAGAPGLRPLVELLDRQPDQASPLLTVIASHVRFPADAAKYPALWGPDNLAVASLAGWSAQREQRGGSRFYPVWVDPVDDTPIVDAGPNTLEVRRICTRHELLPRDWPTVSFAYRLAAGHPAGVRMVLHTLRRNQGLPPAPRAGANPHRRDLRAIFGSEYTPGVPLADAVWRMVRGPWPAGINRGLVLMAVAVDLSDERFAPILREASGMAGTLLNDFRRSDLWVNRTVLDGDERPARLHPFARRAIAERLGQPGGLPELELTWDAAHRLLRDAALADQGSPDEGIAERAVLTELYHRLAMGEYQRVATRLTERFDPVEPRGWYQLLLGVTSAPLARPGLGQDAAAYFGELCDDTTPEPLVTRRLVIALALHTDPLGDPSHDMCRVVATELSSLSRHARAGTPFLLEMSEQYDKCWRNWHPGGGMA